MSPNIALAAPSKWALIYITLLGIPAVIGVGELTTFWFGFQQDPDSPPEGAQLDAISAEKEVSIDCFERLVWRGNVVDIHVGRALFRKTPLEEREKTNHKYHYFVAEMEMMPSPDEIEWSSVKVAYVKYKMAVDAQAIFSKAAARSGYPENFLGFLTSSTEIAEFMAEAIQSEKLPVSLYHIDLPHGSS